MGGSVAQFAEHQAKNGHEVVVFTPDYGRQGREESIGNYRIKRLKPLFTSGNAAFVPQLFAHLDSFDIVHLHYPFFGGAETVLLKKIVRRRQMKLVVHYHMDAIANGWRGFIFSISRFFILPLLLAMSDAIIVSSLDYAENSQIKRAVSGYRGKLFAVPFGVDEKRFMPALMSIRENNVLFVAGLDQAHYFKGLSVLLHAVAKVKKNIPDIKLDIVGDGDLRAFYEELAKALSLGKNVRFLGRVSDSELPAIYRQNKIFVLPSINQGEAFGLVLLEAMASGLAVIASNIPGVRRVFKEFEQGLLVIPESVDDLAEKISMLLNDPGKANRFGQNGRSLVMSEYLWPRIINDLDVIYQRMING